MTNKEALKINDKELLILELLRKYIYCDNKNNLIKMKPIEDQMENFHFNILKEWLKQ